ncbi:NPCBM/NEW2 domain-containing protein [Kribbella italica]|uniref:Glycosyl hydrolase family 98 putative carbohydrate-binding module domain-containing protein n=1 Tax=Kribbella italica TaxID=1540520 RepID=A0A7W9JAF0_9ACTN|nr:NPCBM/NEW2 domain-containing protein [Kribbella italica]MBB5838090.1 hypothetical protein [Kribbella italica]
MRVVVVALLGFVCAVLVGLVVNLLTPKDHKVKPLTLWGVLGLLVVASTGVAVWQNTLDDTSGDTADGGTPTTPVTPTPTPPVDSESAPTTPPTSTSSTPTDDPVVDPPVTTPVVTPVVKPSQAPKSAAWADQYLADQVPLYGDPGEGPATLGGNKVVCGRSVRFPINGFASKYTAEYAIDAKATWFRATLGIDSRTKPGAKVHFLIYLIGTPIDDGYLLTYYDVKEIKVPVKGKAVLKLVTEAVEAGGVGGTGRSAWGNGRFTQV